MLVRDYMSPAPVTITADADYKEAFGIMQERNLHHIPVVGGTNEVVGILAQRDLRLAAQHFQEAPVEVGDVMHSPVTTIAEDADLRSAAERLIAEGIGCLPVMDSGGARLVGIITESDLLRALRDLLARES